MEDIASRTSHEDVLPSDTGQRSVHTKFKLSSEAVEAKKWLSHRWDFSQKETASLVVSIVDGFLEKQDGEVRKAFIDRAYDQPGEPTRKTHVVTEEAKENAERLADELNLTRDQFFDAALRLTRGLVERKQQAQVDRHEEYLPQIRALYDNARDLEKQISNGSPDDDPLRLEFSKVCLRLEDIIRNLEEEIDSGSPLPPDHNFHS